MPAATHRTKVAIIIPVYRPPTRWEDSCLEHIVALFALLPSYKFHVVFVNDSSQKNLFGRIKKSLRQIHIPATYLKHPQNYGKGKALRTGVRKFLKRDVFFVCVDWDFPFATGAINEILICLEKGADIVIADRGQEYLTQIPIFRACITKIWRRITKSLFHLSVEETQAGVKGFNRTGAAVFLKTKTNTFLHNLEFLLMSQNQQLQINQVRVTLRGGIQLTNFSLSIYLRELIALCSILLRLSPIISSDQKHLLKIRA